LPPGFAGADLENLVNEAAALAARATCAPSAGGEFQNAMERIVAGYAVVMHNLEHSDPVHKVSIVSRGMALGYTMPLPENDKYLRTKQAFEDEIVGLLGGRAAEEIIFERVTTGAANDLERATELARSRLHLVQPYNSGGDNMSTTGLKVPRKILVNDLVSGLVMAVVTVPGALANGLLAGVNPVYGVYAVIAGTTVGALFTASVIMNVDSTSATAIAAGDILGGISSEEQLGYLVVLGILIGLFMLIFGFLKLGFLVRFISNAVMTGFLSGLGVLTILGQTGDLTGYYSEAGNKVFQTIDTILHFGEIDPATLVVGLVTIALIILLSRTKLERYAMPIALAIATVLVFLPVFDSVILVGDTTEIPRGLPRPNLPDLSLVPAMLLPAMTIAIIALVQGAGVSQSKPNPDGEYPDPSGDFRGQGAANVAVGVFGGLPVGGSLSGTSLIQGMGGVSRWANIFTGLFAAVILLLLAPLIEILPLTALAGMLVLVGVSMINVPRIETVWHTGPAPTTIMVITFVATLFTDIQVAVAIGVILTFVVYVYRSAEKVRIERIVLQDDGSFAEDEVPEELTSAEIVALMPIGSLFFAGASEFEEDLPEVGDARRAVAIIGLRDRDEVGSTFIRIVERYANELQAGGNKLMLAGLNERVLEQLEKTDLLDLIGEENVFPVEPQFGAALGKAVSAAETWIERDSEATG
jgi:SulP family sulfate permease